jgi:hypothetical protein
VTARKLCVCVLAVALLGEGALPSDGSSCRLLKGTGFRALESVN